MSHAICNHYGHDWVKSDMLTSQVPKGYTVEVCKRTGCRETRPVYHR